MYTKNGQMRIYDNFKLGVVSAEHDPNMVGIAFTEQDFGEEHPMNTTHVFQVHREMLGKLVDQLNRVSSGLVVAGAHQMPKEQGHGH